MLAIPLYIAILVNVCEARRFLQRDKADLIFGGESRNKPLPYHVLILYQEINPEEGDYYMCGGAILSPKWVLSAGHCFNNWNLGTVKAGALYRDIPESTSQTIYIDDVCVYPSYYPDSPKQDDHDVALVHLRRSLIFNKDVAAIPIARNLHEFYIDKWVTVSGWGLYKEGSTEHPSKLQQLRMRIKEGSHCVNAGFPYDNEYQFCMCGDEDHEGPMKKTGRGDSGGPAVLVTNNEAELVGSLKGSWKGSIHHSLFLSVPSHQWWIDDVINDDWVDSNKCGETQGWNETFYRKTPYPGSKRSYAEGMFRRRMRKRNKRT